MLYFPSCCIWRVGSAVTLCQHDRKSGGRPRLVNSIGGNKWYTSTKNLQETHVFVGLRARAAREAEMRATLIATL